jgi:hypothetical protein
VHQVRRSHLLGGDEKRIRFKVIVEDEAELHGQSLAGAISSEEETGGTTGPPGWKACLLALCHRGVGAGLLPVQRRRFRAVDTDPPVAPVAPARVAAVAQPGTADLAAERRLTAAAAAAGSRGRSPEQAHSPIATPIPAARLNPR